MKAINFDTMKIFLVPILLSFIFGHYLASAEIQLRVENYLPETIDVKTTSFGFPRSNLVAQNEVWNHVMFSRNPTGIRSFDIWSKSNNQWHQFQIGFHNRSDDVLTYKLSLPQSEVLTEGTAQDDSPVYDEVSGNNFVVRMSICDKELIRIVIGRFSDSLPQVWCKERPWSRVDKLDQFDALDKQNSEQQFSDDSYDIIVIGGGPVGLAAAYYASLEGKKVIVLEKSIFANSAGSSTDLARMFRTMYSDKYMAQLALQSKAMWHEIESVYGEELIVMSGLLNFGDLNYRDGPEGNLAAPIKVMEELGMQYRNLTRDEIQEEYPFKNLPEQFVGVYANDNGVMNVQKILLALKELAARNGATLLERTDVMTIQNNEEGVIVEAQTNNGAPFNLNGKKLVIATGAYVNDITEKLGFTIDLDIWEMTSQYYSVPETTQFPSMWFQFMEPMQDRDRSLSNLFYGFPHLPWGPKDRVRIALDWASRHLKHPNERGTVLPEYDVKVVQRFVRDHIKNAEVDVQPQYQVMCLMANVRDNDFVLGFAPSNIPNNKNIVVFTAGWAFKMIPLLGKALSDLAIHGKSKQPGVNLDRFRLERPGVLRTDVSEPEFKVTIEVEHHPSMNVVFENEKTSVSLALQSDPFGGPVELQIFLSRCFFSGKVKQLKMVERILMDVSASRVSTFEWQPEMFDEEVHMNYCLTVTRANSNAANMRKRDILAKSRTFFISSLEKPHCSSQAKANGANFLRSQVYRDLLYDVSGYPVCEAAKRRSLRNFRVGIVGAGVTGLFAGHLLKELGIKFHILEADKNRVGGRVYTKYFDPNQKFQYAEAGAMRLPFYNLDKSDHQLVYELIKKLNKRRRPNEEHLELIPFDMEDPAKNERIHFRNVRDDNFNVLTRDRFEENPIHYLRQMFPHIPEQYLRKPAELVAAAVDPFMELTDCDPTFAKDMLLQFDGLSFENMLETELGLPKDVIHMIEQFSFSNGYMRGSFVEAVIDEVQFASTSWSTISGGMSKLTERLFEDVGSDKVTFDATVSEIRQNEEGKRYTVICRNSKNEASRYKYDMLIITAPATIVRGWRLPGSIRKTIKPIIDRLQYDHSSKIYIQFKRPFWKDPENNPVVGGQSLTDLRARKVVYSDKSDPETGNAVICASYTWAQDSEYFESTSVPEIIEGLMHDLAELHQIPVEEIRALKLGHHVQRWNRCPNTKGAFAYFLPNQLSTSMQALSKPHDGIYFAGEHTDIHHAWIVAALNSALRVTDQLTKDIGHHPKFVSSALMDAWVNADTLDKFVSPNDRNQEVEIDEMKDQTSLISFAVTTCQISSLPYRMSTNGTSPSAVIGLTFLGAFSCFAGAALPVVIWAFRRWRFGDSEPVVEDPVILNGANPDPVASSIASHQTQIQLLPDKTTSALLAFSAGTLLFATFFDVLPHSVEYFQFGDSVGPLYADLTALGSFLSGLFLYGLMEFSVHLFSPCFCPARSHRGNDTADVQQTEFTKHQMRLHITSWVALIVMTVHHIPEGLMFYLTATTNTSVGIVVGLILLVHVFPEGISVGLPTFLAFPHQWWRPLVYGFVAGLGLPLGAVLGYVAFQTIQPNHSTLGWLYGLIAGLLTMISFKGFLPGAYRVKGATDGWVTLWALTGAISIFFAIAMLSLAGYS